MAKKSIVKMTTEECIEKLSQIEQDYKKAQQEINHKRSVDKTRVLKEWAQANSRFKVGDVIEADGIIIEVEDVFGCQSAYYAKGLYCTYKGRALTLTKKLTPRKDEWVTTIADDGRVIKLVKKNVDTEF